VLELGEVANDLDALEAGIRAAMAVADRPSLVVLRSHIGYPSPKFTDTAAAHGAPLGADEIRVVKEMIGLPVDETFTVPDDVLAEYRRAGARGAEEHAAWSARHDAAVAADAERAAAFDACVAGRGLPGWDDALPSWPAGESVATRNACAKVLEAIVDRVPGLVGGGADLTGNTGTALKGAPVVARGALGGRQLFFGVREHGMGSVMVGMAEGGLLPFGGTFFVFSDYMRPAVRVAALSGSKVAFVWSHDSIAVGEDGPTHQPVEQLAALRAMPGLRILRPADANETAAAWRVHLEGSGPSAIVLSRQNLPVLEGTSALAGAGVAAGAYVLERESGARPDVVLIGTGSEVALCVEARAALAAAGTDARVVSMPSWDLFAARSDAERAEVLPEGVPRLSVEAGTTFGWARWADASIGIDTFGASAPGGVALERFGFTVDAVVRRATALVGGGA
jgi:transketolase